MLKEKILFFPLKCYYFLTPKPIEYFNTSFLDFFIFSSIVFDSVTLHSRINVKIGNLHTSIWMMHGQKIQKNSS